MRYTTLTEIKDILPKDSWWSRIPVRGEYSVEYSVLLIEDDIEIKNLDLDEPGKTFSILPDGNLTAIVCLGNLKTENIYNRDTDGSCSLIVLKDLLCKNMVVGGQEIYVGGNLTVEECFWGHYNHGDLIVKGKPISKAILITEEYHFDDSDRAETDYILTDFDEDSAEAEFFREILAAVFLQSLLYTPDDPPFDEAYGYADGLKREECIDYLERGQSILKDEPGFNENAENVYEKIFTPPASVFYTLQEWKTQEKNVETLLKICELDSEQYLGFEIHGWTYLLNKEMKDYPGTTSIVARNGDLVVSVAVYKTKNLFGKSWKVKDIGVYMKPQDEEEGFYIFTQPAPPEYYEIFTEVWATLLNHAERGIHFYKRFLEEVKPEDITRLCTLPIVLEKYNDWYDDDKNGFWCGDYYYAFLIPGTSDIPATLKIAKEIQTANGCQDFDCRSYKFQNDSVEHPTKTQLFYNFSQSERIEGRYKDEAGTIVYFFDDKLYAEALQWYRRAKKIITEENNLYLNNRNSNSKVLPTTSQSSTDKPSDSSKVFANIMVTPGDVRINQTLFQFPDDVAKLKEALGDAVRQYYDGMMWHYIWDQLGIYTTSVDGCKFYDLWFYLGGLQYADDLPKSTFQDHFDIGREGIEEFGEDRYTVGRHKFMKVHIESDSKKPVYAYVVAQNEDVQKPLTNYGLPSPAGKGIEFSDFNFKLLVIEELMYNQKILKPKFDIWDFAKQYTGREINIEEEGYKMIPEALEFFKKIEITSEMAEKVAELCQDGGNDVYLNIAPLNGGDGDFFRIQSFDDVKYFPNLKKMTIFTADTDVGDELKAKGIEAEFL